MKHIRSCLFFMVWRTIAPIFCHADDVLSKTLMSLNDQFRKIITTEAYEPELTDLVVEFRKIAFKQLKEYRGREIKDKMMKRQIELYLNMELYVLPEHRVSELESIDLEMVVRVQSDYSTFHQMITKTVIDSREREKEVLLEWIRLSTMSGPFVQYLYEKFFRLISESAKELNYSSSLELWKEVREYIYIDAEEFISLWDNELHRPYRELMNYMRHEFSDLFTYYNKIEYEYAPMPAYIYDLIYHTYNEGIEYTDLKTYSNLTYARIFKYYTEVPNKNSAKIHGTRALAVEAQKYFESLGFDQLDPSFWNNSIFRTTRHSKPEVTQHYQGQNKYWLEVDGAINANTLHKIHEKMFRIHKLLLVDEAKLPLIFWEPDYLPFFGAFREAVLMPTVSLKQLVKLGFFSKDDASPHHVHEWFKGTAVSVFTSLASAMATDTWRWLVLQNNITEEDLLCEKWNSRIWYEWAVPLKSELGIEMNENELNDVYSKNPFFGINKTFNEFATIILTYQIYARFCEIAGQYNPNTPKDPLLYKCDFTGNIKVGQVIRDVLKAGSTKGWRELLKMILGPQSIGKLSATGLLDYFEPLFNNIKKKKKINKIFNEFNRISVCRNGIMYN